jgi:hypothetical protein
MRLLIAIVILVAVAMALNWVQEARQAETRRLAEKPRSEKFIPGNIDRGKIAGAKISAHDYKNAFIMFKINKGKNPASIQELIDAHYLDYGAELDPFGQKYELQYVGREAVISSPGGDKVRGTPDDIVERVMLD